VAQRKKKTARVQNTKPTADRSKGALAKRPKAELIDVIVDEVIVFFFVLIA